MEDEANYVVECFGFAESTVAEFVAEDLDSGHNHA
jgi:hypothetical protein